MRVSIFKENQTRAKEQFNELDETPAIASRPGRGHKKAGPRIREHSRFNLQQQSAGWPTGSTDRTDKNHTTTTI
ncbi:hypothetical protein quinque_015282 [Culex quinquefasciatus]